jgi:hypothetical protein
MQQSRPSTTGQAPAEQNRAQENRRDQGPAGTQGQRGQERTQGQNERGQERSTQGQNPRGQERTQGQNEREQNRTPGGNREQARPEQGQNQRGQQPNRTEGRGEQGNRATGGTSSVNLSSEQRTRLRQTVIDARGAPKVSRVDFPVTEGTIIPRTVHVVAVPETLVEIHPEWRGYDYFVYNDEIIIVEPDTFRIVAIVAV